MEQREKVKLMATISIDRSTGEATPVEIDLSVKDARTVMCMVLTGMTPDELAKEMATGQWESCKEA
ncbi:hypothetical protein [Eubacterium barkeri]|nr:hypothetical protein [Eubacterium barkeri]